MTNLCLLQIAINSELHAYKKGTLTEIDATIEIAKQIERYKAGEQIAVDARIFFPFWYRGLYMQGRKHA